jgi:hypothetical protein
MSSDPQPPFPWHRVLWFAFGLVLLALLFNH